MSLKKSQAWRNFSKYIKLRDGNRCFICGRKASGQGLHAGHFVQAFGHQNTFFDETNVHSSCYNCNINLYGNILQYRRKIIEKYGVGYDEILEERGRVYKQWSKKELKEIANFYEIKINEISAKICPTTRERTLNPPQSYQHPPHCVKTTSVLEWE